MQGETDGDLSRQQSSSNRDIGVRKQKMLWGVAGGLGRSLGKMAECTGRRLAKIKPKGRAGWDKISKNIKLVEQGIQGLLQKSDITGAKCLGYLGNRVEDVSKERRSLLM